MPPSKKRAAAGGGQVLVFPLRLSKSPPVFGAIYYKQFRGSSGSVSAAQASWGGPWSARGPRPAGSARSGASHGFAYLGGKSAGGGGGGCGCGCGCGRSSVGAGGPARSSGHRGAGAIPAEAGVRGCHTCITAPTPPPPPPPPAQAQHAARPRHSEPRGRAAPGSSVQRDQILTRFLPRPRH